MVKLLAASLALTGHPESLKALIQAPDAIATLS